jgi:ribosomal protein L7/L12
MTIQSILIVGAIILIALVIILGKKTSSPSANNSTAKDIEDAVNAGDKIGAIKHYRYVHKVGLKQAKDAVEKMQNDT